MRTSELRVSLRLNLKTGKYNFKLIEQYVVESPYHEKPIEVPEGYETNGATIPWRIFWVVVAPIELAIPHVAHDWLYQTYNLHTLPKERKKADKLLRLQCKEIGMGIIRRNIIYFAVRIFGRFPSLYKDK